MDKRSRDQFEKGLKEQRQSLQQRLSGSSMQREALAGSENKDEGDRASASTSSEMSAAQQAQAENLLRLVNAALGRIDDGTFGECRNCGQEIGPKRLQAIPWAQYCITCQELIEGGR
jgi:DnaK suppressor protein